MKLLPTEVGEGPIKFFCLPKLHHVLWICMLYFSSWLGVILINCTLSMNTFEMNTSS